MLERIVLLCGLWTVCSCEPQYMPQNYPRPQSFPAPSYSAPWQQYPRTNYTTSRFPNPNPSYQYPNPQPYPDPPPLPEGNYYGLPPAPPPPQFAGTGYPQIYKIDNLIIIANPPQQQAQPCVPQPRPPLEFPTTPPADGDDLGNKIGGEPSKCTWAIVACCSPDSAQVRYNCFELLGCPGFFFDNSPCEPKIVMAAANAALEFYRSASDNSSDSNGSNTNKL